MAGSVKWMNYTADDGTAYSTLIDESNGILFGFTDVGGATASAEVMPKYLKMRRVNLKSADGKANRSVPVGSVTNDYFTGVSSVVTLNGINYNVTSTTGEKRRRAYSLDTGLDDGTAE